MINVEDFFSISGYKFKNKKFLKASLTHPSLIRNKDNLYLHYERLELLGDAILRLVITDLLLDQHPDYREGKLSQKIANLTSRECCYQIGKNLKIDQIMEISKGEERNGGRVLMNNISNTVEAIIGAIYLDSKDISNCNKFISTHWKTFLTIDDYSEPKTILQEWSQSELKSLPSYKTLEVQGSEHEPNFIVELTLSNDKKALGRGRSKKNAEKDAATNMLSNLKKENIL